MKKIIETLVMVMVVVSVAACSNPSDSIGYYPTAVQTTPQGESSTNGQGTQVANGGSQENPDNGNGQNGGQGQPNGNPNEGNQGESSTNGQGTQVDTIVKFTKLNKLEFYLDCDSIEFPSEGYYVYVTYKGTKYKVENFKYSSNDIQSMSATGYDKTSQRFYFKFDINDNEAYAFISNEAIATHLNIKFNRGFVKTESYVGLDTSNGTLIIYYPSN